MSHSSREKNLEERFESLRGEIRKYFSPEGELLDQSVGIAERILCFLEALPPPDPRFRRERGGVQKK